jgi:hypothetical protein
MPPIVGATMLRDLSWQSGSNHSTTEPRPALVNRPRRRACAALLLRPRCTIIRRQHRHFAAKQPDDLTVRLQLGRPRMTFFTDCASSMIMHRVGGFEMATMSRRDRLRWLVPDMLWPTAREGAHATGPVHSGIPDQVVICLSTTLVRVDDATFLCLRHCRRWRCANA